MKFRDLNSRRQEEVRRNPKGGRPAIKAEERKGIPLSLRFSLEELLVVEALAKEQGLSIRAYVRASALRQRAVPVVPAVNFDAIDQLRRIGNNINQALVAVYTKGLSPSLRPALLELITLLRKLRAELAGKEAVDYEHGHATGAVIQPANDADLTDIPADDEAP